MADVRVTTWLSSYWLIKELGKWPPGRLDPQLLEACAVIAGEHAACNREELQEAHANAAR
jgi:hypothetical protein